MNHFPIPLIETTKSLKASDNNFIASSLNSDMVENINKRSTTFKYPIRDEICQSLPAIEEGSTPISKNQVLKSMPQTNNHPPNSSTRSNDFLNFPSEVKKIKSDISVSRLKKEKRVFISSPPLKDVPVYSKEDTFYQGTYLQKYL